MPRSDVSEGEKMPKSTFEIYRTEGDSLFRGGDYNKSAKSYTQALELRPGDRHCLVARSKCFLQEGNTDLALADAEASLAEDNQYHKGIYQKAEVLYFKGEFEKALVFYHRGYKLRPEMEAFRLGIQKTEEAINNSVGDPHVIKLKSDGDLSYFFQAEEAEKAKKKPVRAGYQKPKQAQDTQKKVERNKATIDSKAVRQLLGELYVDREYLEKILKEEEVTTYKTEHSDKIREIAISGLNYLDSRSEFWQQRDPMYSRKHERRRQISRGNSDGTSAQHTQPIKFILTNLDEIDYKQSQSKHPEALKQAEVLLKRVNEWSEADVPNKAEVLANIYSLMGNSLLELQKYERALQCHEKDLEIGKANDLDECMSRAMDNLGRVYAKMCEYQKAVQIWEEKLPKSKSSLEATWLNHEIGRCYLELGDFSTALKYGEKSLEEARVIEDDSWQLNACVLVAQAKMKAGTYETALDCFQQAQEYAKLLSNHQAEEAIKGAIEDVNQRIHDKSRAEKKGASPAREAGDSSKQASDAEESAAMKKEKAANETKTKETEEKAADETKEKEAEDKDTDETKEKEAEEKAANERKEKEAEDARRREEEEARKKDEEEKARRREEEEEARRKGEEEEARRKGEEEEARRKEDEEKRVETEKTESPRATEQNQDAPPEEVEETQAMEVKEVEDE